MKPSLSKNTSVNPFDDQSSSSSEEEKKDEKDEEMPAMQKTETNPFGKTYSFASEKS